MEEANRLIMLFASVIINPLIVIMFAVALLVFVWGVAEYVRKSGTSSDTQQSKKHILFGILGMVIMVSAFTIMNIILRALDIDVPPTIQTSI